MSATQSYLMAEQVRPEYIVPAFETKLTKKQPDAPKPERLVSFTAFKQLQEWFEAGRHEDQLNQSYVIDNRDAVNPFLAANRLYSILREALPHLDAAFSKSTVKTLSLITDDEGSQTLFCFVMWKGEMEAARAALQAFDEGWWLTNSRKIAEKLNFDFELI
jgi:hypothetical protein